MCLSSEETTKVGLLFLFAIVAVLLLLLLCLWLVLFIRAELQNKALSNQHSGK